VLWQVPDLYFYFYLIYLQGYHATVRGHRIDKTGDLLFIMLPSPIEGCIFALRLSIPYLLRADRHAMPNTVS